MNGYTTPAYRGHADNTGRQTVGKGNLHENRNESHTDGVCP